MTIAAARRRNGAFSPITPPSSRKNANQTRGASIFLSVLMLYLRALARLTLSLGDDFQPFFNSNREAHISKAAGGLYLYSLVPASCFRIYAGKLVPVSRLVIFVWSNHYLTRSLCPKYLINLSCFPCISCFKGAVAGELLDPPANG